MQAHFCEIAGRVLFGALFGGAVAGAGGDHWHVFAIRGLCFFLKWAGWAGCRFNLFSYCVVVGGDCFMAHGRYRFV